MSWLGGVGILDLSQCLWQTRLRVLFMELVLITTASCNFFRHLPWWHVTSSWFSSIARGWQNGNPWPDVRPGGGLAKSEIFFGLLYYPDPDPKCRSRSSWGLDRTWTGPLCETVQYSKIIFFFINNIQKVLYKIKFINLKKSLPRAQTTVYTVIWASFCVPGCCLDAVTWLTCWCHLVGGGVVYLIKVHVSIKK